MKPFGRMQGSAHRGRDGAVALGRTVFGVFLVIAYGLGMAATFILGGPLLVRIGDCIAARTAGKVSTRLRRSGLSDLPPPQGSS